MKINLLTLMIKIIVYIVEMEIRQLISHRRKMNYSF